MREFSLKEIFELLKIPKEDGRPPRLLFYGIGNVGRQDDGLGIRLIDQLEDMNLPAPIEVQSNYQLNIEDALEISNFDVVVFVDATVEKDAKAPFAVREILPSEEIAFSTHAMGMESILGLADQLYGKAPRAFVLTMPGVRWEICDELTETAQYHLKKTTAAILVELGIGGQTSIGPTGHSIDGFKH